MVASTVHRTGDQLQQGHVRVLLRLCKAIHLKRCVPCADPPTRQPADLLAMLPHPAPSSCQVIAILIGTNNEMEDRPAFKLGVLLTYLERLYPASKLLVIPPPPSWQRRYIPMRDAIGAMLKAHPRVFFSLCGAGLDPSSFDDMKDGVRAAVGGRQGAYVRLGRGRAGEKALIWGRHWECTLLQLISITRVNICSCCRSTPSLAGTTSCCAA